MGKKAKTLASVSDALTPWEKDGSAIAYEAALEGIVLLENDGTLPLQPGRVALYGAGARKTVKGGTGSGEVNERHSICIEEGLEQAGFTVTTKAYLAAYDLLEAKSRAAYTEAFRKRLRRLDITSIINFMSDPYCPPVGQAVTSTDLARSDTDTCIYVISRQAGEGSDRKLEKHDYSLTPQEHADLTYVSSAYAKTVLVINVGGVFDMGFLQDIPGINAVVFFAQQGGMGGKALADLLRGEATFSGHLTDTWAHRYTDYPCATEFGYLNGNLQQEYYREGIYVGYRWFDTFDIPPKYPFGYGLSYTDFSMKLSAISLDEGSVEAKITVKNTGNRYSGKAVAQLYASCPQTPLLPKEYQRLVGFAKTRLLAPGEEETVSIRFPVQALSSYNTADAATILDKGVYLLRLGSSSRDTHVCARLRSDRVLTVSRHTNICPPSKQLQELEAPAAVFKDSETSVPELILREEDVPCRTFAYRRARCAEIQQAQQQVSKLTVAQCLRLVTGAGMIGGRAFDAPGAAGSTTSCLKKKGIDNIILADGPAGIRLQRRSVRLPGGAIRPVEPGIALMNEFPGIIRAFLVANPNRGQVLYQFTTAFPVELALAQSWNVELVERIGQTIGQQMQAYGVSCWLAPALNIHRNVLCGRNFEYFSEDPLMSGLMAAALSRGVQSIPGRFVTLKHFTCNNQEDNRNRTNANVSERALREIYLKGFEIATKEGSPRTVMSSYNRVNGVYTPNSHDLLTKILRQEWGFDGLVMTDWYSTGKGLADSALCIRAGNDLLMPGMTKDRRQIKCAIHQGRITRDELRRCAANVLRLIRDARG